MRTIEIKIETVEVKARARRILDARVTKRWRGRKFVMRIPWRLEPVQDIVCHHSLDIEEELTAALTSEINR